jgi:hypothetical protein
MSADCKGGSGRVVITSSDFEEVTFHPPKITDTDRLRWLMVNSGIDSLERHGKDRYDAASEACFDRTGYRDAEPTVEDELDGFRRIIDEAMGDEPGAGIVD